MARSVVLALLLIALINARPSGASGGGGEHEEEVEPLDEAKFKVELNERFLTPLTEHLARAPYNLSDGVRLNTETGVTDEERKLLAAFAYEISDPKRQLFDRLASKYAVDELYESEVLPVLAATLTADRLDALSSDNLTSKSVC